MTVFPIKDIKNVFGQVIWFKGKSYNCEKMPNSPGYEGDVDDYVVTCELIGNEYPILSIDEIKINFYTIEDQRDMNISEIVK